MTWFFVALSCAVLTACSDALSKRIMEANDEWITGGIVLAISGLIMVPVFVASRPGPVPTETLYILAAELPFEILGYYLFLSALRMAPLSLTLPLLAFTPVFAVVTSALIVGEWITLRGGLGISLVTVGAYLLNANLARQNLLKPLRALWTNHGSRRMLIVAFVWSLTTSIGKKGILIYGAIPYGFLVLWSIIVVFGLTNVVRVRRGYAEYLFTGKWIRLFFAAGTIMAAAEVTHFVSLSLAPVAYMISVKRLSLVFGVILGWFFFKEEDIRYRLVGASIMVSGVFFLYH
jgi:drug/metabolite transporter (DMT)-like permease